ncbi:hypothetical protein [Candidatus Enterococcus clewellii]|uniref:Uncharacterized protein n=1 Tax=Candidatus Enterococcus clewellii TaxID=1834193 RepID=A0A242K8D5_9ENTE|nr:hypothetical protein [Enterococcus sp. 9E7_DIV0242]OTP17435.1 hypothetical protein A5888_001573 [Enterococcus sp. 9E7_DIV0242]
MRDFLIAVGLIAVCFFGYFYSMSEDLLSGVVVDKSYKDAYSTTDIVIIGDFMYPQTNHHPESYKLQIEGERTTGEQGTKWISVDRQTYDNTSIGDEWINDKYIEKE